MHVDEVLSVLIDGTPHVSLALLVLVAPLLAVRAGAGGGLLLGAVVAPRHHGLVGGFAVLGIRDVAVVGLVAVILNHLAGVYGQVKHKGEAGARRAGNFAKRRDSVYC